MALLGTIAAGVVWALIVGVGWLERRGQRRDGIGWGGPGW